MPVPIQPKSLARKRQDRSVVRVARMRDARRERGEQREMDSKRLRPQSRLSSAVFDRIRRNEAGSTCATAGTSQPHSVIAANEIAMQRQTRCKMPRVVITRKSG